MRNCWVRGICAYPFDGRWQLPFNEMAPAYISISSGWAVPISPSFSHMVYTYIFWFFWGGLKCGKESIVWKTPEKNAPQLALVTHYNLWEDVRLFCTLMYVSRHTPPKAFLCVPPCELTSHSPADWEGKSGPGLTPSHHHNLRMAGLEGTSDVILCRLLILEWEAWRVHNSLVPKPGTGFTSSSS